MKSKPKNLCLPKDTRLKAHVPSTGSSSGEFLARAALSRSRHGSPTSMVVQSKDLADSPLYTYIPLAVKLAPHIRRMKTLRTTP